jgi:spore coat polysaccharide biosynthesis protein SpsF
MRIVAVTQARTGSSRLPGKVLKKIQGVTLLELHLSRILQSKKIDKLIVATTVNKEDDAIAELAAANNIAASRGSVNDVLDRFYQSLKGEKADYVVRLTADCPLIDPALIDKIIAFTIENDLDYCSNTLNPGYPDGQDVEVFKFSALEKAWHEAKLDSEREHVTPFIWKNSSFKGGDIFTSANFSENYSFGHLRMTVDEQRDFDLIQNLIGELGRDGSWLDYANYIESHQKIRNINASIGRNEGYDKSIEKDKTP